MNKNIDYEYIKQMVADRLRAICGNSAVVTEISIREGRKKLGRADIVFISDIFGPEIIIVKIKVNEEQIDTKVLEQIRLYNDYANEAYLCLPKKQCSPLIISLCRHKDVGLVSVNIDSDDGPIGALTKKASSIWNPKPKEWIDLYLRLEKLGLYPLYFV